MPNKDKLFKTAIDKIKRNVHLVFLFSDLMSYKEIIMHFPQLEYHCEVIFLEDLRQKGYLLMAENFLSRTNIEKDLIAEEKVLAQALCKIRNDIK